MNQPIPTGPDLFTFAADNHDKARRHAYGEPQEAYHQNEAAFYSKQAHTAALVMLTEVIATATSIDHYDLDAWREKIGMTWLKECRGKDVRRPQCTPVHTEDCAFADPIPEPKHVRIPVGTRVLVSERAIKYPDGRIVYDTQPKVAKVVGYDTFNSRYQLNVERFGGGYYDFVTWAFVDNRVQPHPEQDTAVPAPTGPRVYVRKRSGKQGHIVDLAPEIGDDGLRMVKVQWYTPGCDPVWVRVLDLEIITASEVDRCPNGQTGDECGSGENQCEQCVQADDAEGDMIEESMGLR